MNIQQELFKNKDEKFAVFQPRIVATKMPVVGVRTPILRKIAKEISKDNVVKNNFLNDLPHKFFEENQIHGMTISLEKDFDYAITKIEEFLPYMDSWATTDQMNVRVFDKNMDKLLPKINEWIDIGKTFYVRFGMLNLMQHYFNTYEKIEYSCKKAVSIKTNEYYVKMMQAWLIATAVTKEFELGKQYIEKIEDFETKKMAIRKCLDSFRLTESQKQIIRQINK